MKARHILGMGAAVVVAAGVQSGSAAGTPAEGEIVRTDLAKGTTDASISIVTDGTPTTLYVQSLLIKAGASSGWHTHPGPEYSVITKGTVHLEMATSCGPVAFTAGEAAFIPAGITHKVMNQGPDDAEVVVTYTVPADRAVRDDAPVGCP